jgi:hypothetical protein
MESYGRFYNHRLQLHHCALRLRRSSWYKNDVSECQMSSISPLHFKFNTTPQYHVQLSSAWVNIYLLLLTGVSGPVRSWNSSVTEKLISLIICFFFFQDDYSGERIIGKYANELIWDSEVRISKQWQCNQVRRSKLHSWSALSEAPKLRYCL